MAFSRLTRAAGLPPLAYVKNEGTKSPGILYLGGYMSQKHGYKPTALRKYLEPKGYSIVTFDYTDKADSVLSDSSAKLWSLKQWKDDVITALDQLTTGPQILIGSSMGAWMALLAAVERPERVASIVTISAAIGFTERYPPMIPQNLRAKYESGELIELHGPYGSFPVSKRLVDEGREMNFFTKNDEKVPVKCPIRCLHSVADSIAPYSNSITISERVTSENVDVLLRKSGDHLFSRPEDLETLYKTVDDLICDYQITNNKTSNL